MENFLVVQRLGLCDLTAGGLGLSLGGELRSHKPRNAVKKKSEAGATKKQITAVTADAP